MKKIQLSRKINEKSIKSRFFLILYLCDIGSAPDLMHIARAEHLPTYHRKRILTFVFKHVTTATATTAAIRYEFEFPAQFIRKLTLTSQTFS